MLASIQPKIVSLIDSTRSLLNNVLGIKSGYKLGVIIAVLLLSLGFGAIATLELDFLILLAIAGIGVAVIFLRKPQLGFLFIIIGAMFVPSSSMGGTGGILNPALILVGFLSFIWIFDVLVRHHQIAMVPSKTMLPAIVFIIVSIIAFLNSQLLYTSFARTAPIKAQIAGLGILLFSVFAFILTANQIKELIWLERLTWLFVILGSIYIVFARLSPAIISTRIRPLFQPGSDASIFWIWLVVISASQAFYNQSLKIHLRVLLIGILIATIFVGFGLGYYWKSGWIPPLIGLGVTIWFGSKRWRIPILLAGFFLAIFSYSNLSGILSGGEDYSLLTRFPAYMIVLEIFKLNPILGVGIANYYWYTPIYRILGYVNLNFSSHNNYIDLLAQMGIVGLFCFIWLFWTIGQLSMKLKDRVPSGFPRAYVLGAIAGLVATLVAGMLGDWVTPFVYNVGLNGFRSSVLSWIFLGGLVALQNMYLKTDSNLK